MLTGTGYASTDFGQWGSLPEIVFFTLMFIGGCAGSAACGMNVFRVEIVLRTMWTYIRRMLSPNRIIVVRYGHRRVQDDVLQSVMTFIFLYLFVFSVSAVLIDLPRNLASSLRGVCGTPKPKSERFLGENPRPVCRYFDLRFARRGH